MKNFVRFMSDRQTTVVTVPSLDFNSLQDQNLQRVTRLFQHAAECAIGNRVILDVTSVRAAGTGFLTEVHRLAAALASKQVQLVIAGDLGGLFRLVGWQRRFRLYDSLVAAMFAWPEWHVPSGSLDTSSEPSPDGLPRFASESRQNGCESTA